MEKIYKKDINKLMPILQALVEGKTIQFATTDKEWVDLDGNKDGLSLETLINNPQSYRIKSKSEFRPFKDMEECWEEMKKHQPFGWVKTKDKGIRLCMSGLNQKSAFTQVGHEYDEAFDEFIFADGLPFGVKVEE